MINPLFFLLTCFLVLTEGAYAHWGHVGELSGHGHWIAVGAVVVAGALAGLIGKLKEDGEAEEDAEGETDELEGEPA